MGKYKHNVQKPRSLKANANIPSRNVSTNHGLERGPQLANHKYTGKYWTLSLCYICS